MTAAETGPLWDLLAGVGMSMRLAVSGFCLHSLLKGALSGKRAAVAAGVFYSCALLALYWVPAELDALVVYPAVTAATAWLVCHMEAHEQRRFIIFLCITFYALREIAVTIAGSLYGWLYNQLIMAPQMTKDPHDQTLLFCLCLLAYTGLTALLLLLAVRTVRRAYPAGRTQLSLSEFWLLAAPSLAASAAAAVLAELRYPIASTAEYATATLLAAIVLAVLFAAILGSVVLFARISEEQQRRRQQEALAVQMSDMHEYVDGLETLYAQLRAFRHDIANHLEILHELETTGNTTAAKDYAQASSARLGEVLPAVRSGNPVTDIILSALQLQAKKRKVKFTSLFHFPPGNLSPFDIGVIIHNAGVNALEGAAGLSEPFAVIRSFRHRHAYVVECTNRCREDLTLHPADDLPPTDKSDPESHGFGLANIRSIASRYNGWCEAEAGGGIFTLTVILMLPEI